MPLVAKEWATRMNKFYDSPDFIRRVRPGTEDGTITTALFAATRTTGDLAMYAEEISFDRALFDSGGTVKITSNGLPLPEGAELPMGLDEIGNEFLKQTTERARHYMSWFLPQLPAEPRTRAWTKSEKLVELSILLHSKRDQLGFPIDTAQLLPSTGVTWRHLKNNCPTK